MSKLPSNKDDKYADPLAAFRPSTAPAPQRRLAGVPEEPKDRKRWATADPDLTLDDDTNEVVSEDTGPQHDPLDDEVALLRKQVADLSAEFEKQREAIARLGAIVIAVHHCVVDMAKHLHVPGAVAASTAVTGGSGK